MSVNSGRLSGDSGGRSTAIQHADVRKAASRRSRASTLPSLLLSSLICFLVQLLCSAEVINRSDSCSDVNSDDATSCSISNDDTYHKVNSRVPQDCTLVMAPSGIPGGGWGVFTLTPRKKGQRVMDKGDIIVHLPDPNPRTAHEMRRLIWDYAWDGQQTGGHYEGLRVFSISSGMGALANGVAVGANVISHVPSVDDAGLVRGLSPGAGAASHHHNYTWITDKDLAAGDELLIQYGAGWMKERGFDQSASPKKFDVAHLREVGYCLDNMVPRASLLEGAGRGAFASRDLEEGTVVAPVPLIPLSRSSLDMIKERKNGDMVVTKQLLQNYCFGHEQSSLLLYPYSHGVNYINHDSASPNVELRWWKGSHEYFDKSFLELQQSSTSQLMLELVATRPIINGEELYLDYGQDWENAWKEHVESWQQHNNKHICAESLNKDDNFTILRTAQEQQSKPYPEDIFTSCYYRFSDYANDNHPQPPSNSAPVQSVAEWKHEMIATRNLRPCIVVKRDRAPNDHSYLYTVHVTNRPTLDKDERIPKGHMHFVTNVPRHAIVFSDKTYTTDQHLENAFRKEIGLGDIFTEQWKNLP